MLKRLNTISTAHTGDLLLPKDTNRAYFFIVMLDATGTIEFGGGGGAIPLAIGGHYQPPVAPTGTINIVTSGSFVLHIG